MRRAGFRWDWDDELKDQVRVSADVFDANTGIRENPTLVQDVEHKGRNVLTRWNHHIAEGNDTQAQFYYDHVDYDSFGFTQSRDTFDLELQHSVRAGQRHLLVWGAGFRNMRDDTRSGLSGLVDVLPLQPLGRPHERLRAGHDHAASRAPAAHAGTEVRAHRLRPFRVAAERAPGVDAQPRSRPGGPRSAMPRACPRASKATSRSSVPSASATTFRAEHVRAYEIGQRWLVTPKFWYDVALFYNDYDDLRTGEAAGRCATSCTAIRAAPKLAVALGAAGAACALDAARTPG